MYQRARMNLVSTASLIKNITRITRKHEKSPAFVSKHFDE